METEEILAAIQKAAETIATPNWADIASVGLSLLAVVVAGFVAWKQNAISLKQAEIAEQQNKIVLFEKRYTVYEITKKLVRVAEEICDAKNMDDIFYAFQITFNDQLSKQSENINDSFKYFLYGIYNELGQARFLFPDDIYITISGMQADILLLCTEIRASADDEAFQKKKTLFCASAQKIKSEKIIEKMKEDLQLQSIRF